jgi:hypothetical protein
VDVHLEDVQQFVDVCLSVEVVIWAQGQLAPLYLIPLTNQNHSGNKSEDNRIIKIGAKGTEMKFDDSVY